MALNDDIALCPTLSLFADIGEDKLRLIAFGAERRRVAKGHELFREGAPADCAYAVAAGSFALSECECARRQQQVMTVGRGALLSELALISMSSASSPRRRRRTAK